MLDPKQTTKFSKGETELLSKLFGGDNPVLYILRNALYQFELTTSDRKLLEFSEDGKKLLKKILLPENSPDTPIGWTLNMYQNLKPIKDYSPEGALIHIKANDILIDYITQRLNWIFGEETKTNIMLEDLPKEKGSLEPEQRFIDMLAYHNICAYVEGRIIEIRANANPQEELTPEQQKEKNRKNSNK